MTDGRPAALALRRACRVVIAARHADPFEVDGFQPSEAYDMALANLDPALERHPAPEDSVGVVFSHEHGTTTAEVASIMRGELEDPTSRGPRNS
jgi:hypothetical protein